MTLRARSLLGMAALVAACGGEPLTREFQEPIRVQGADFVKGELPGLRPLTGEEQGAGVLPTTPTVVEATVPPAITVGAATFQIPGAISPDGAAVAFRFADIGTGYWVRPATTFDASKGVNGAFGFGINAIISSDAPIGKHQLVMVGIGPEKQAGTQQSYDVCLEPRIPDKLAGERVGLPGNACDPTVVPPALIVSLAWDAGVDLDLKVVTPSGKLVDPKHPTTDLGTEDHDPDPEGAGIGVLDRDSNGDCAIDGLRRENLVFAERPLPGRYAVYASLNQACGEKSTRFSVSLTSRVDGAEPETYAQVQTYEKSGLLLAAQADGGAKLGLYVTEFVVE